MVSYEELIYCFTDIYLKSAMECSICKENYAMVDDTEFLDEFMKVFVSLLMAVEKDDTLSIEQVKKTLLDRKKREIAAFQFFLKHKVAEQALEKIDKDSKHGLYSLQDDEEYTGRIRQFFQEVFDEESLLQESPAELLRYVRAKEEKMQERN